MAQMLLECMCILFLLICPLSFSCSFCPPPPSTQGCCGSQPTHYSASVNPGHEPLLGLSERGEVRPDQVTAPKITYSSEETGLPRQTASHQDSILQRPAPAVSCIDSAPQHPVCRGHDASVGASEMAVAGDSISLCVCGILVGILEICLLAESFCQHVLQDICQEMTAMKTQSTLHQLITAFGWAPIAVGLHAISPCPSAFVLLNRVNFVVGCQLLHRDLFRKSVCGPP